MLLFYNYDHFDTQLPRTCKKRNGEIESNNTVEYMQHADVSEAVFD